MGKSSYEVMESLSWVRRHGFQPVPLHPRRKAAVRGGFESPTYQPPPDEEWERNNFGIGVALGPAHGGLVDADLDTTTAAFFAPKFFPLTQAVFGREGKPSSHRLFRISSDKRLARMSEVDPLTEATIIELRGDGHQTVLPGSLHEDTGQLIEWTGGGYPEVTSASLDELIVGYRKTAIASLVAEHLWAPGLRNLLLLPLAGMLAHRGWSQDDVETLISAVMEHADDRDQSRIKTVRLTFVRMERGVAAAGAPKLRKLAGRQLEPVVDAIARLASDGEDFVSEYNDRFAVVNLKGAFRVVDMAPPIEDAPWPLMTKGAFLDLRAVDHATVMVTDEAGNPKAAQRPKAPMWLASPSRRQYDSMDFLPGEERSGVLNMFRGWAIEPSQDGSCEAWLELMRDVICGGDEEKFRWHLNWFADILRQPERLPRTAPVWVGTQGAGKSLALDYFGAILGKHYMTVGDERHVTGHFNAHLADILLLHSAEALYAGDKKHRAIIKTLITDQTRNAEPKGVDAFQVRNRLRLAMTSNYDHAAAVERDDRRHTSVKMGARKAPRELIERLLHELANGGPARLHHFLTQEFEYDANVPIFNIKDDDLLDLKFEEIDPVRDWWLETLQSGQLLPDDLSWAQLPKGDDDKAGAERFWPRQVSTQALHVSMRIALRQSNFRGMSPSVQQLMKRLRQFLSLSDSDEFQYTQLRLTNLQDPELQRPEVRGMSERPRVVTNFPTLAEARQGFEQFVGHSLEWLAPLNDGQTGGGFAGVVNLAEAQARQRAEDRLTGGKY